VRRNNEKKSFALALGSLLLALNFPAEAQSTKKIPRIGFLEGATVAESQGIEPFRQGLRELGYVDGQNIILEVRSMRGKPERIPDIVAEFVSRKVDLIFTPVTAGAHAAKKATATIPIVVVAPDPLGSGLVTSLARPGGNVTGLSAFAELAGKRLEILTDTLTNINRVAVFWNPTNARMKLQLKGTEAAARVLGVKIQSIEIVAPDDFDTAFKAATRERAGALIALRSPMLVNHRKRFLKLVENHRLPATTIRIL
jgi:putative tryptophan/tyrosine transport system substrate-binding protein